MSRSPKTKNELLKEHHQQTTTSPPHEFRLKSPGPPQAPHIYTAANGNGGFAGLTSPIRLMKDAFAQTEVSLGVHEVILSPSIRSNDNGFAYFFHNLDDEGVPVVDMTDHPTVDDGQQVHVKPEILDLDTTPQRTTSKPILYPLQIDNEENTPELDLDRGWDSDDVEVPSSPQSDLGVLTPTFDTRSEVSAASRRPAAPSSPRLSPASDSGKLSITIPEVNVVSAPDAQVDHANGSAKMAEDLDVPTPAADLLTPKARGPVRSLSELHRATSQPESKNEDPNKIPVESSASLPRGEHVADEPPEEPLMNVEDSRPSPSAQEPTSVQDTNSILDTTNIDARQSEEQMKADAEQPSTPSIQVQSPSATEDELDEELSPEQAKRSSSQVEDEFEDADEEDNDEDNEDEDDDDDEHGYLHEHGDGYNAEDERSSLHSTIDQSESELSVAAGHTTTSHTAARTETSSLGYETDGGIAGAAGERLGSTRDENVDGPDVPRDVGTDEQDDSEEIQDQDPDDTLHAEVPLRSEPLENVEHVEKVGGVGDEDAAKRTAEEPSQNPTDSPEVPERSANEDQGVGEKSIDPLGKTVPAEPISQTSNVNESTLPSVDPIQEKTNEEASGAQDSPAVHESHTDLTQDTGESHERPIDANFDLQQSETPREIPQEQKEVTSGHEPQVTTNPDPLRKDSTQENGDIGGPAVDGDLNPELSKSTEETSKEPGEQKSSEAVDPNSAQAESTQKEVTDLQESTMDEEPVTQEAKATQEPSPEQADADTQAQEPGDVPDSNPAQADSIQEGTGDKSEPIVERDLNSEKPEAAQENSQEQTGEQETPRAGDTNSSLAQTGFTQETDGGPDPMVTEHHGSGQSKESQDNSVEQSGKEGSPQIVDSSQVDSTLKGSDSTHDPAANTDLKSEQQTSVQESSQERTSEHRSPEVADSDLSQATSLPKDDKDTNEITEPSVHTDHTAQQSESAQETSQEQIGDEEPPLRSQPNSIQEEEQHRTQEAAGGGVNHNEELPPYSEFDFEPSGPSIRLADDKTQEATMEPDTSALNSNSQPVSETQEPENKEESLTEKPVETTPKSGPEHEAPRQQTSDNSAAERHEDTSEDVLKTAKSTEALAEKPVETAPESGSERKDTQEQPSENSTAERHEETSGDVHPTDESTEASTGQPVETTPELGLKRETSQEQPSQTSTAERHEGISEDVHPTVQSTTEIERTAKEANEKGVTPNSGATDSNASTEEKSAEREKENGSEVVASDPVERVQPSSSTGDQTIDASSDTTNVESSASKAAESKESSNDSASQTTAVDSYDVHFPDSTVKESQNQTLHESGTTDAQPSTGESSQPADLKRSSSTSTNTGTITELSTISGSSNRTSIMPPEHEIPEIPSHFSTLILPELATQINDLLGEGKVPKEGGEAEKLDLVSPTSLLDSDDDEPPLNHPILEPVLSPISPRSHFRFPSLDSLSGDSKTEELITDKSPQGGTRTGESEKIFSPIPSINTDQDEDIQKGENGTERESIADSLASIIFYPIDVPQSEDANITNTSPNNLDVPSTSDTHLLSDMEEEVEYPVLPHIPGGSTATSPVMERNIPDEHQASDKTNGEEGDSQKINTDQTHAPDTANEEQTRESSNIPVEQESSGSTSHPPENAVNSENDTGGTQKDESAGESSTAQEAGENHHLSESSQGSEQQTTEPRQPTDAEVEGDGQTGEQAETTAINPTSVDPTEAGYEEPDQSSGSSEGGRDSLRSDPEGSQSSSGPGSVSGSGSDSETGSEEGSSLDEESFVILDGVSSPSGSENDDEDLEYSDSDDDSVIPGYWIRDRPPRRPRSDSESSSGSAFFPGSWSIR